MSSAPIELRDLSSLEECRSVVALQEDVWGRDGETVPSSVLLVSAKRGGILIGAFAGSELVGFVWSMPGRHDGRNTHWSHMLAVKPAFRRAEAGLRLKLAQRERALADDVELIEWTFDPLQAANAHFNLHVLGAVGSSYLIDVYGALAGLLHRGTPTDRLVVEWWLREPHVERRLRARERMRTTGAMSVRSAEVAKAPEAFGIVVDGAWVRPGPARAAFSEARVLVPVPPSFSDMQQQATAIALEWRLAMRDALTQAFAKGYRAVDFLRDEESGGRYLLARGE
jgi:chorismate synthase